MEKKSDGLPFKWGKRRGPCVENEDVQYYESFTYGGCEYRLYDCVSVGDDGRLDSPRVFFVGKIIKMWEYTDQRQDPRRVELLWFFKPSELSVYLEGVGDVLANELFLASGSGVGLTNENLLEAISGKCRVLCISKDVRNPQPSEEELKSADFLFHRTYDVGTSKILDKIDDEIAGVDVKFIFNRTSSERKASALQKVATDIQGTVDSLKPNHPSTSGSVMQNARNASDLSGHKQLARKQSTLAEERSNKDSGRLDGELDSFSASGSRRNDCHVRKDQDDEVRKQLAKQKPRLADERCSKDSHCLDDMLQKKRRLDGSPQKIRRNDGRKDTEPIRRDATVGKSRLAEEIRSNDFYGLDVMPLKKPRLDGSVAVSDGRRRESQNISHDVKKDVQGMRKDVMVEKSRLAGERCSKDYYMPQKKLEVNGSAVVSDGRSKMSQKLSHDGRKDPRDNVTRGEVYSKKPSFTDKNQDLRIPRCSEGKETRHVRFAEGTETRHVRFSEGQETRHVRSSEGKETRPATEKGLIKKSSPDCKISKHSEEKSLTNADYRRHYRVSEVTQKPNVEGINWFRKLSWEEDLRDAEGKGTLVVLRNLDPSYTSSEVENIIYSALNVQCTARMIERTSATIPHIGEALVIFETMDAAKRVIRRLHEGCLLLPNGRVLVATSAKVNPPAMPSLPFPGHINIQRRGKRSTAVTSHCCQGNNIEFEMGMEWWLHLSTYKQIWRWIYERQIEEKKKLQLGVQPKHT
ncbi:protein ANTI-SILENCING 1 isoform X1 [Brassica napus]|uniref:BAH domain-containing protein n=2 Tax=Brassica TaxID=3705 RepID=A0A3P6DMY1_BRAOL|nr:protein ANTI-SILENCING 1 isoform X1 [Brassica napus]XP_022565515.2 protein ANTI-SILENCING 1 isoform X1 [Brassica napus]CAF1716216.1 unnamed protein product [Brassica napus]VDD28276.1 unnamed protein product [Brassica oleracea]